MCKKDYLSLLKKEGTKVRLTTELNHNYRVLYTLQWHCTAKRVVLKNLASNHS